MKRPQPSKRRLKRLERSAKQILTRDAVTAGEITDDVLAFIGTRYQGRHLDIETVMRGLSNAAHDLIVLHLRMVAKHE